MGRTVRRSQQPLDDSEVPVVITENSSSLITADAFDGTPHASAMGRDDSAAQRTTFPHRKPTDQTQVHVQVAAAGQDNDIPPQSEQERLSGIYRVQIAARIARSLENDRLVTGSCVARLDQKADGAIAEVVLGDCGGDKASRANFMDTEFPNLPAENVVNTDIGVSLATVGGGVGICTPTSIAK